MQRVIKNVNDAFDAWMIHIHEDIKKYINILYQYLKRWEDINNTQLVICYWHMASSHAKDNFTSVYLYMI